MSTVYEATIGVVFFKDYELVRDIIGTRDDYPPSITFGGKQIEFESFNGVDNAWGYDLQTGEYCVKLNIAEFVELNIDTIRSNLEEYFGFKIDDISIDLFVTHY